MLLNLSGVILESSTSSSLAGHIYDQTVGHGNPNRKLAVWASSGKTIAVDGLLYDNVVNPLFLRDAEGIFFNDLRDGDKVDILLRNHTFLLQNGYLQRNAQTENVRIIILPGIKLSHYMYKIVSNSVAEIEFFTRKLEQYHGKIVQTYRSLPFIVAEMPYEKVNDFAEEASVAHVFCDQKCYVQLAESVPIIKPPEVWQQIELNFGFKINGSGVKIAILDTGIDKTHPDLDDLDDNPNTYDPKVIAERCFTDENHTWDGYGHGTHCASIAAGTGEASGYTYVGVAPAAFLMNGKVLTDSGWGYLDWVISGIEWAVNNSANVISMSLSAEPGNDGTDPLSVAVDWAVEQGVVCVVAAGNWGNNYFSVGCPACAVEAITVGATDKTDRIAWFSSFGPTSDLRLKPEVVAPGVDIVAARANGTAMGTIINAYYTKASGTSMATPHVAGAVALLLQAHPSWTSSMIKAALVETGKSVYSDALAEGGGRIQIAKAVNITSFAFPSTLNFGKIERAASLNLTVCFSPFTVEVLPYFDGGITVSATQTGQVVSVEVGGNMVEGYYSGVVVVSGGEILHVPFFVAVYQIYPSGGWRVVNEKTVPSDVPHRFLVSGNTLYVGCFSVPGSVYKYSLPDLTLLASATLPLEKVNSMVLLGGYLYVGTATVPAHLYQLNATDLSIIADRELPGTNALALIAIGNYLFVSYSEHPGRIDKVDPATLQTVKSLNLGSNADAIEKMVSAGNYLYAGVWDYAGSTDHYSQILKIDPSSLAVLETLSFNVGLTYLIDMVVVDDFIYACTWGCNVPAKVVQVDLASFQVVNVLTLGLYDTYVYGMEYASNRLYFASANKHGIRVSLSTFKKDSELPLSDQAVEVAAWRDYLFFGGYQNRKIIVTRDLNEKCFLTVLPSEGGTTDPTAGTYEYPVGSTVQVTAIPDDSHTFSGWLLDGASAGTKNPLTITMDANHTLKAVFTLFTYNLTISVTAGGTTDPTPGTYTYANGTVISVTAILDVNYKFEYWILDGVNTGSDNPIEVLMDANHTLEAVFTEITYQLSITTTAGGTTVPAPGTYVYANGSSIIITAIPDANYKFVKWQLNGSDAGSTNPITIIMDANYALHAVFQQLTYRLTILSSTGGTTNPGAGTYVYVNGTNVSVDAIPDAYYVLDHWLLDGVNVGSADPIYVLMTGNHTLQPIFARINYTLTISATTGGTTNPAPGVHTYNGGTTVDVTAIAAAGYRFDHWILDSANAGSNLAIQVLMDANHDLQAVFVETHTLVISVPQGGTTNPAPGTYKYDNPTNVTVTAIPETNYRLDHWEFDGNNMSSANPITVYVGSSHTLRAVFTLITYSLTIQATTGDATNPAPGTYTYVNGTEISVAAIPDVGFSFDYWLLDGEKRTENPIAIIMDANHTLQAVFKDIMPPVTADDYDGLWHNADFTITLSAEDVGSGVAETYYRINGGPVKALSVDGQPLITAENSNNTLEYWSVDKAGNEELPHKILTRIKLDKSPPISSIVISGDLGNNDWFISNVTVTFTAFDGVSGINNIEYSFNNITWTTYTNPLTITSEGYVTIYYRSADIADNIETAKSDLIKLDKTAPFGSILINENATYVNSTSVTLTLSVDDATSGVAKMRFSSDNITWTSWETYNIHKAWTFESGDGVKTVYAQFMDNAGLISQTYADSIILDETPPVIVAQSRIPEGDVEPNQEVWVFVNATDLLSGLKNVTLSYNLSNATMWIDLPLTYNSTLDLYEAKIPGQQEGTFVKYMIIAYDNAGNQATKDNNGYYYKSPVIPEFTTSVLSSVFILLTLIATKADKRKNMISLKSTCNVRS